jgi:hypothetical protein
MAKSPSNSRGRAPTTSEFNDLWRRLLAAANAALDGEVDADGVQHPPTAAVMEMCRKIISDVKLSPSQDVAEDARRVRDRLPFNSPDPDTF